MIVLFKDKAAEDIIVGWALAHQVVGMNADLQSCQYRSLQHGCYFYLKILMFDCLRQ